MSTPLSNVTGPAGWGAGALVVVAVVVVVEVDPVVVVDAVVLVSLVLGLVDESVG